MYDFDKIQTINPGKASFNVVYERGRDNVSNEVTLLELGNQAFYDELFVAHANYMFEPGEERKILLSMDDKLKITFIKQLIDFRYYTENNKEFMYCGIKIILQ
jgi:hypothetical protein